MPSITIRDVPEEVLDELVARAQRSGRSLQEYLLAHLAEFAQRPDPAELWDRISERKLRMCSSLSGDRILEMRDHDR